MKHLPSDKYTIAWFKLAEFISRGEKEKALGIYRLLALSINDTAFINKLEGDILSSFNDKSAEEKYYKAAVLYQKDEKFIESIAIYENLLSINIDSSDYLYKLLDLYKTLNLKPKLILTKKRIFFHKLKKNEIFQALEVLKKIENLTNEDIGSLYEEVIFKLININADDSLILKYIAKILDNYYHENKKNDLQKFISKLEVINKNYYKEALKQIKE